jgi:hypothetical protein
LFTRDEVQKCRDELTTTISRYMKSIQSYFPTLSSNELSREQFTRAFQFMGLELSTEAQDHLFLRLFQLGGFKDPNTFNWRFLFDEWGGGNSNTIP